ncbi:MAG: flagellar basal body-associated FliL family protein [Pseudomonadota bacterium]
MASDSIDDFMGDAPEPKKESSGGFIVALALGTVIAAGTGWFLGGQFTPQSATDAMSKQEMTAKDEEKEEKKAKADEKDEDMEDAEAPSNPDNIIALDPILTVLQDSDNVFMRLELAIVLNERADEFDTESKLRLHSDLSALSRTLTLRQISGPSGYLHLRDDLIDRARLISDGIIKDVLVLSMVAE